MTASLRGPIIATILLLAACAPATKLAQIDELSPAQRELALLLPGEPPKGLDCPMHFTPPPAPEAVLDVAAYRAALDRALGKPPAGAALLSVGIDSTRRVVWFRVLHSTLPDSTTALVGDTLKGYLKAATRDGHATGWQHRLQITPAAQDGFVRVGESYRCLPRIRNRSAITQRLNDGVRDHPNIAKLPDRQRTTSVWVHVGRDGSVLGTRIARSSGRADVDRIAVDAASIAIFEPAVFDGQPYAMWINLPVIVVARKTGS